MLKPKKTISKKEIKEDKLVTSYFEARSWFEENKKLIGNVAGVLAAIVIAGVFYFNNVNTNNKEATTQLGKVLKYYDDGKYEIAVNGNPQENIRGLQSIVDDYGSTKTGRTAKLFLANAYYALGKYDKALEYFLDADLSDDLLKASALAGGGACYETKGDHANAALYFERAAAVDKTEIQAPENLHHAALNYAASGNKDKAIDLLKRLKKDYSNSAYAREADRFIAEFSS